MPAVNRDEMRADPLDDRDTDGAPGDDPNGEGPRILIHELNAVYGDEPLSERERALNRRRVEKIGALLRADEDEPWE